MMANHQIGPRILVVAIAAITKANIIGASLQTKRETTISGGRITKRIRAAATRLPLVGEAGLHLSTSRIETATEQITIMIETMLAPNLDTNKEEIIATIIPSP